MPDVWGCSDKPYSILTVLLQLLTSSKVVWGIQGNVYEIIHLHCIVVKAVQLMVTEFAIINVSTLLSR